MTTTKSSVFFFDDIEVRESEFCVVRAGETVPIEPRAFRVLLLLLRNPQKLISKEELLSTVWDDVVVTENSLARTILKLRQRPGDDVRSPRYIETVTRIGYRFICPVRAAEDPPSISASAAHVATTDEAPGSPALSAEVLAVAPSSARRAGLRWVLFGTAAATILAGLGCWYLLRPVLPPHISAYTQITSDGRSKEVAGTDGSRVYFTQNSPSLIAQVGINGGEVARFPVPVPASQVQLMDISPDGSNALVGTLAEGHQANAQWIVPILGGAPKPLEDGEGEAFSPTAAP